MLSANNATQTSPAERTGWRCALQQSSGSFGLGFELAILFRRRQPLRGFAAPGRLFGLIDSRHSHSPNTPAVAGLLFALRWSPTARLPARSARVGQCGRGCTPWVLDREAQRTRQTT